MENALRVIYDSETDKGQYWRLLQRFGVIENPLPLAMRNLNKGSSVGFLRGVGINNLYHAGRVGKSYRL